MVIRKIEEYISVECDTYDEFLNEIYNYEQNGYKLSIPDTSIFSKFIFKTHKKYITN